MRSVELPASNAVVEYVSKTNYLSRPNATCTGLTGQELRQNNTYEVFDYTRSWDRFINLRALSASENVGWQKSADYAPNSLNRLTLGCTALRIPYIGVSDNEVLGSFHVKYYITFRGIK